MIENWKYVFSVCGIRNAGNFIFLPFYCWIRQWQIKISVAFKSILQKSQLFPQIISISDKSSPKTDHSGYSIRMNSKSLFNPLR